MPKVLDESKSRSGQSLTVTFRAAEFLVNLGVTNSEACVHSRTEKGDRRRRWRDELETSPHRVWGEA